MFNRKGQAGLVAIVIILIALVFLGWIVNIGHRECSTNGDCPEDNYCGSDFSCHEYPNTQKIITKVDYTTPAIWIGIAILIVFFGPRLLDFIKDMREQSLKYKRDKEEKATVEPMETKSKNQDKEQIYVNYPASSNTVTSVSHSPSYSIKLDNEKKSEIIKIKEGLKSMIKDKEPGKKTIKNAKNNIFNGGYIGMILGGLAAIGIVIASGPEYILASFFGAAILFILIYKLWDFCIEYNAEYYLITILSLMYILLSLVYIAKGGLLFTFIALGFFVITIFVIKETVAWIEYRKKVKKL